MRTFIIGDVQGCYRELQSLLKNINYNPDRDRLGFVGDLVNRGPDSLAVLQFVKRLKNPLIVLGNHDLHLLELAYGIREPSDQSLIPILKSKQKTDFIEWLRHQPLMLQHEQHILVHAGFIPQWNITQLQMLANEVHAVLSSSQCHLLLKYMRGNEPTLWSDDLIGWDRLRFIINATTRICFCNVKGELDLVNKTEKSTEPTLFKPWFEWIDASQPIIFGHWASLRGQCYKKNFFALDTGCVWGGPLTAIELTSKKRMTN